MNTFGKFTPNEFGGHSRHRQVRVTVGNRSADIDARLAPLITELWRRDIDTYQSCEDELVTRKVWIGLSTHLDAERFLHAIFAGNRRPKWARYKAEYFVNLLFPRSDLTEVTLRMRSMASVNVAAYLSRAEKISHRVARARPSHSSATRR